MRSHQCPAPEIRIRISGISSPPNLRSVAKVIGEAVDGGRSEHRSCSTCWASARADCGSRRPFTCPHQLSSVDVRTKARDPGALCRYPALAADQSGNGKRALHKKTSRSIPACIHQRAQAYSADWPYRSAGFRDCLLQRYWRDNSPSGWLLSELCECLRTRLLRPSHFDGSERLGSHLRSRHSRRRLRRDRDGWIGDGPLVGVFI